MTRQPPLIVRKGAWYLKRGVDAGLGVAGVAVLNMLRFTNPDALADFAAAFMRRVGPWFPEHRIGRDNLKAAFPEKSDQEIKTILMGVWENLGRLGAEFAHLDSLGNGAGGSVEDRFEFPARTSEIYEQLRNDGKPAFLFAAHLANWEILALAGSKYGLDTTIVYRTPNMGAVANEILERRAGHMGRLIASTADAPFKVARALEAGSHVGMLVDQHFGKGVDVIFFGRRCKANPLLARLARHYDCPIHGVRVVRLGTRRFRAEITEAVEVPRDPDGRVNVQGTMQAITSVVEGWVREHPEQWLWLHRRWR